jgi:hypothetical protein
MEKAELLLESYEEKRLLEAYNKDLEIASRKLETYARLQAPKPAPSLEKVKLQFIFLYTSEVFTMPMSEFFVCNVCMVSYPTDAY